MKFAHLPDCHLGSWSGHPDMREYSLLAFERAIDLCIKDGVDFILQCGDFFDTSLPSIDVLRRAVTALRKCREAGIPFYMIVGSHDFSPTGKTMVSVLEDAGLLVNIAKGEEQEGKLRLKFTTDSKTGTKLAGIIGKKNSLDREYFECLDHSIENESGRKIFAFHAAITEYKPKGMQMISIPMSYLPKGFSYYASGHVHKRFEGEYEGSPLVYSGVLFPTSFDELEEYASGFYIVDNGEMRWTEVKLFDTMMVKIKADGRTPNDVESEIREKLKNSAGKFVLLKVSGALGSGKPSDVDFHSITQETARNGALSMKINRNAMTSREFEEIKIRHSSSIEEMEKDIISEHEGQLKMPGIDGKNMAYELMNSLKSGKMDGETNAAFEERIISESMKVLLI